MEDLTIVTTLGISIGFVAPIAVFFYGLYRLVTRFHLTPTERDAQFKMFTLAALSAIVAGNKVIPMFRAGVFSQDIFVVFLTMPITMFYYNYFLRESSLKKKTVDRFHKEMLGSSLLSCLVVAIMMRYME